MNFNITSSIVSDGHQINVMRTEETKRKDPECYNYPRYKKWDYAIAVLIEIK